MSVNPFLALDRFGIDAMRFYLAHDGSITNDVNYDNSQIVARYKKGLQDGLGNLAYRILRSRGWSMQEAVAEMANVPHNDMERSELLNAILVGIVLKDL